MNYFDFEEASNAIPPLHLEIPSIEADLPELPIDADLDDQTVYPNPFINSKRYGTTIKLQLINDCEVEGILWDHHDGTDFPMYRAKQACALCSKMGLDCFLSSRGALITGCTCCIALFRECSFTHPLPPNGYVPTMSGIAEDSQMCHGTTSESRPPLRSFEEAKGRKTGARFPRDAVKILKRWLTEHAEHPYPNEREREELKQMTGLRNSQISNWLANARRRGKVRPPSGPSSPMLGAMDIPGVVNVADLGPMDRWKASPPENEPAAITDIARAISAVPQAHPVSQTSHQNSRANSRASSRKASSEDDSNWSVFRAPTVSSFGTRDSTNSDLSFASSHSHQSKVSKVSHASSQERRRRRRAPMTQRAVAQASKSRSARIFQCTFCTDTFPSKYDWQRHEKSLHLALERWSCCPTGGAIALPNSEQKQCVFCSQIDPSEEHLEEHNYSACHEKGIEERTFYRKDHLRQHLKLMHEAKFNPLMEAWKSTTNDIKSRCGFCSDSFTSWQARVDHLAVHFRSGADMANWSGDLGLDLEIEKCVENAIPPYLIGLERSTVHPYIAKATCGPPAPLPQFKSVSPAQPGLSHGSSPTENSPNQQLLNELPQWDKQGWSQFESYGLTNYVREQQEIGAPITDKQIQDHARLIVYGSMDPVDWTIADNEIWLNAFKSKVGLNSAPAPIGVAPPNSGGSSQGPQTPAHSEFGFPAINDDDFDMDMPLDFDAADFADLNIDDLGNLNTNVSSSSFALANQSSHVMEVPSLPVRKHALGQATFDHFDLSFDMSANIFDATNGGNDTMSAHDLDQLTQYMAGFSPRKI